ncbi:MAG: endonuclease/exonuclease/phosphatase family protein [Bacteroidales bacterium]|nr:endonuclease/exonuclease/phosphatase family protein [Bacteroidales bacterium]
MKKITLLALSLLMIAPLFAQKRDNAVIAFYNLENLFDTENDPLINDEQFLPDGDYQWTEERYQRKLENMSKVISLIAKEYGGPVAIGVSEVENRRVLEDLVATDNLKPFNLGIVHYDSPDRRGVDVALLYQKDRFRVIHSYPYRLITEDTNFRTRDQILVTGIIDEIDTVNIIVNHWPSKLGGEKRSMPKRIAAAELSKHISDSLMHANPAAKVLIMGDLNDNPNAKSIVEYLQAKGKVKDVGVNQLFNPMYKLYMDGIWSYVYRDEPNVIDQIIISDGLLNAQKGFKYKDARIFRASFLLTKSGSFEGIPLRTFAGGNYLGGYSDHLPVFLILDLIK